MKTLFLMFTLASAFTQPAVGSTSDEILEAVHALQPNLGSAEAVGIAHSIEIHARAQNLDWRLLLSILFQESSLHQDPHHCGLGCADLGIGQVNWKTWGSYLKLDKRRLVSDFHYAIGTSAQILANYRDRFASREAYWYGRYNSGTPQYRLEYQKRVETHYAKIREPLKIGHLYERLRRIGFSRIQDYNSNGRRQAVLHAGGNPNPLHFMYGPDRKILGTIQTESRNRFKVRTARKMG